jgi:hypothetical protein
VPPLVLRGVALEVGAADLDLDIDDAHGLVDDQQVALVAGPVALRDEDQRLPLERLVHELADLKGSQHVHLPGIES